MELLYSFKECKHHNVCLYNELCIKIGFEECVDIRRREKEFEVGCKDHYPYVETICTGSVAEGFRHGQTDRDYMKVLKDITVLDSDAEILYSREPIKSVILTINKDPEYWNEGYVILKIVRDGENVADEYQECIKYAKIDNFVSSYRFKEWWIENYSKFKIDGFMHGPCVSISGSSSDQDIAFSLECKFWPSQAKEWLNRTRLWPSKKLVDEIAANGCHLVPLGPVKDVKDDLLWRLSFNNAEKKLVFAFNQTQFLCYGLLKIVLKECIEKLERYPKNTLCSYFIKTLLFWLIQDTAAELWQPHNIVICFVVCLVRLTVWVKREECPNFFIPSRNMFKLKVQGLAKTHLLNTLKEVQAMGVWNCFAKCSKRFHITLHYTDEDMKLLKPYFVTQSFLRECRLLSSLSLADDLCQVDKMKDSTKFIFNPQSELDVEFFTCLELSMYQRKAIRSSSFTDQEKYFTKAKNLDLTRGPLMLATSFYCNSEFPKAIEIIKDVKAKLGVEDVKAKLGVEDVNVKPGEEKFTFYAGKNNANMLNIHNVHLIYKYSSEDRKYSLGRKREQLLSMDIIFPKVANDSNIVFNERNTPEELLIDVLCQNTMLVIHPLVYLYFLEFLCYTHIFDRDRQHFHGVQAKTALNKLNEVVCDPRVCTSDEKAEAHLIMGISYEREGLYCEALHHYNESLKCRRGVNSALQRSNRIKVKMRAMDIDETGNQLPEYDFELFKQSDWNTSH